MTDAARRHDFNDYFGEIAHFASRCIDNIEGIRTETHFRIKLRAFSTFDASIKFFRNSDEFVISINEGILRILHEELTNVGRDSLQFLLRQRVDRIGIRGKDRILNLVFANAIVFVIFHECAHALGGHVEFQGRLAAANGLAFNGFVETGRSPASRGCPPDIAKTMELEADGFAVEVLHDVRFEVASFLDEDASTVADADRATAAQRRKIGRLVLFSAICTGLLLEKCRSGAQSDHPTPEARILNIVHRYILKECRPIYANHVTIIDHQMMLRQNFSESDIEKLMEVALLDVTVALARAEDLGRAIGIDLPLFADAGREIIGEKSIQRDMAKMMVGLQDLKTAAGRELLRLTTHAADLYAELAPFRRMVW